EIPSRRRGAATGGSGRGNGDHRPAGVPGRGRGPGRSRTADHPARTAPGQVHDHLDRPALAPAGPGRVGGPPTPPDATAGAGRVFPLELDQCVRLADLSTVELAPGRPARLEIEAPKYARPYWLRCFAEDGGVELLDPPRDQLRRD